MSNDLVIAALDAAIDRYRESLADRKPAHTTRPGDIILVAPDTDARHSGQWFGPTSPAVWYVSRMFTDPFPYFTGNLITNVVEAATEADWISPATPWRSLVQGELYGSVSTSQIIEVIAHAGPHKSHLRDLDGHDEHGRPFLPLGGPDDPRRWFKDEELFRLLNFVGVTRRRLTEGMCS